MVYYSRFLVTCKQEIKSKSTISNRDEGLHVVWSPDLSLQEAVFQLLGYIHISNFDGSIFSNEGIGALEITMADIVFVNTL